MFIGIIASIGNGLALPIFTLLFKDLVNGGFNGGAGASANQVRTVALEFLYLSVALIVCGTLASGCLLWSATRQGAALRRLYLRSILRQDIAWFDTSKTGEITTSIERDCGNVEGAIGEKMYGAPPLSLTGRLCIATNELIPVGHTSQCHIRAEYDDLHRRHRHWLHSGLAGGARPHRRAPLHRRRRGLDGQEPLRVCQGGGAGVPWCGWRGRGGDLGHPHSGVAVRRAAREGALRPEPGRGPRDRAWQGVDHRPWDRPRYDEPILHLRARSMVMSRAYARRTRCSARSYHFLSRSLSLSLPSPRFLALSIPHSLSLSLSLSPSLFPSLLPSLSLPPSLSILATATTARGLQDGTTYLSCLSSTEYTFQCSLTTAA